MEVKKFKLNDIEYNLFNTTKYKTICGFVSLNMPYDIKDATYFTLINRLIGASSTTYKTKKELSNRMYDLYDCTCFLDTYYSYSTVKNSFYFKTINGKLVGEDNLFKDTVSLLKDIIFNPLVDEGGFDEHNFLEEKKALEQDIKNVYNNKRRYAYGKMLQSVDPNSYISFSNLGDLEVLKTIDRKKLFDFYLKMLNESEVVVGIIGDVTEEEVKESFSDLVFPVNHYENKNQSCPKVNFKDEVTIKQEKQANLKQALLIMAYRFNINFDDEMYVPLLIFNQMFGSMFTSSLFQIVREKNGFAYEIGSDLTIMKKLLTVNCGLEKENIDKTINIINEILEDYRNGKYDEGLFNEGKDAMINSILDLEDSAPGYLSFELDRVLNPRNSLEEIINKINNTKFEDIQEVSKLIKLDTIYTLVEGEENE